MNYVNGRKVQDLYTGQAVNGQNPVIPGLIAHYSFDNISGITVADETGRYPGTMINSPAIVDGPFGRALDFVPASDQYVNCGTAMGTVLGNGVSDLGVSMWFKADITTATNDGLFYIGDLAGSHGKFQLYINADKIFFALNAQSFNQNTAFTDTASWHHLFAQYTGSKGQLWLDNSLVIDVNYSSNLDLSGLKTVMGIYYRDTGLGLDGKEDQVRIYCQPGGLTVPEINQLYTEKVGPWTYQNGKPF